MIRFASSQKLWDADVRDDTLGNGLSESVKLRDVTTTLHSETDVDVGKLLGSNNEDGLVDLVSEESAKQLVSVYTDYSLAPRFRPTWHPSFLPQCLNILPQPACPPRCRALQLRGAHHIPHDLLHLLRLVSTFSPLCTLRGPELDLTLTARRERWAIR
jgi:hypothetical protein